MSRLGPLIDIDSDRLWCCLAVKGCGKEDHHGIKIWKEPYGGSRGEGVGVLCWIRLVRLMFVLFLGLLLMWYWCVQATLCVFSWRVRISLCNFKRCDILGLNTKSLRSCSATVSALRGIPASCALEFASEFSAGVFPLRSPQTWHICDANKFQCQFQFKGWIFFVSL